MHPAVNLGEEVRRTNENSTRRLPFVSFFSLSFSLLLSLSLSPTRLFSLSLARIYNKTIGGKQMNIKTITLMDFDWGDFIGPMKVNTLAPNYDFQRASLARTFGHLFKLNSLTTAITKADTARASRKRLVRNENNRSDTFTASRFINWGVFQVLPLEFSIV